MRVAVIGGGASAVTLIDALARSAPGEGVTVSVFEPRPYPGPGRPYGGDAEGALINRPAEAMSVRHTDPGDFCTWLGGLSRAGGFPFVDPRARFQPRWLFGRYLRRRLAAATAQLAAAGSTVVVRRATVEDLYCEGGRLVTCTSDGQVQAHDHVVLCLGTPRPADVYGLAGRPGFVADPYPLSPSLPAGEPVTVLGSNLSAVDCAVALLRRGHGAPIRLVSRSGLLPSVRCVAAAIDPVQAGQLADAVRCTPSAALWSTVRRLLYEGLLAHGASPQEMALDLAVGEPPADRLARQLGRQDAADCWRGALLPLLDPVGELLWQRLPLTTRQAFLRRHNTAVATVLNPMPPATAALLLRALRTGALEVHAGITAIDPVPGGGFTVWSGEGKHRAGVVLNAVRATPYDPAEPAGRLLGRLAARGLARIHPCGGVYVDFPTNRVLGPARGLYALGHPTAGDLYYANAGSLLGISARAERIAARIRPGPPPDPTAQARPGTATATAAGAQLGPAPGTAVGAQSGSAAGTAAGVAGSMTVMG
ncbi:FAD/NAD(P)-binding protein, partial [Streptomyces antioxidans]|uniref:FAD/NAD(P)-binding protein n=1 Tax=Streptomyces antioxidans TaxID=1507734 RepID=UPI001301B701